MNAPEPVYEPIEVAIALALYEHNVSPLVRVEAIYKHFRGECAELPELLEYLTYGHAVTALPFPSAEVYVQHALRRYGAEARRRVQIERRGSHE